MEDQYGNASMKGISPESQVMLEVLTTKSNSKGDKEEVVMADLMCYFTQVRHFIDRRASLMLLHHIFSKYYLEEVYILMIRAW